MIDIHPPHHSATTRREFFVHLFIVILGILIAISLEQTVEFVQLLPGAPRNVSETSTEEQI